LTLEKIALALRPSGAGALSIDVQKYAGEADASREWEGFA
jgi:hypothetical protein